jgi:predicted  nucleic acid-binding Zn-ribbon protein
LAILNELLAEAASRAVTLAGDAQDAGAIVDDLRQGAESLIETLDEEAGESHQRLQELQTKLQAAEGALEQAGQRARTGLQGLTQEALSVQSRIGDLAAALKGHLADLDSRRSELAAPFEQEASAAARDFGQVLQVTQEVKAGAEESLTEAAAAVASLRAAVADARDDLEAHRQQLFEGFAALESAAHDQARLYVESMGRALTAQTKALFDLDRRLKDAHNATVVPLRKTFAEEAVTRLVSSAAAVRAALESLGALGGDYEQALLDECTSVLDRLDGAAASLARSQALMESMERLA